MIFFCSRDSHVIHCIVEEVKSFWTMTRHCKSPAQCVAFVTNRHKRHLIRSNSQVLNWRLYAIDIYCVSAIITVEITFVILWNSLFVCLCMIIVVGVCAWSNFCFFLIYTNRYNPVTPHWHWLCTGQSSLKIQNIFFLLVQLTPNIRSKATNNKMDQTHTPTTIIIHKQTKRLFHNITNVIKCPLTSVSKTGCS
jgi:hypothetical protein